MTSQAQIQAEAPPKGKFTVYLEGSLDDVYTILCNKLGKSKSAMTRHLLIKELTDRGLFTDKLAASLYYDQPRPHKEK